MHAALCVFESLACVFYRRVFVASDSFVGVHADHDAKTERVPILTLSSGEH